MDYTVDLAQLDASQLLQAPAGYTQIVQKTYLDPSTLPPGQELLVETVEWGTATGLALGPWFQGGIDDQVRAGVQAAGSDVYQYVLYKRVESNVTVPTSFSIPDTFLGVPIPGVGGTTWQVPVIGGQTLFEIDHWYLVVLHSQAAVILALVVAALAAAWIFYLIANHKSVPQAINELIGSLRDWSVQLAQAPLQGVSNSLLAYSALGLVLAIFVASLNKSTNLGLTQPQTPSIGPPSASVALGGRSGSVVVSSGQGGGGAALRSARGRR